MEKICEVCLKNDMLCQACEGKLEEGRITETEIALQRFLYKLREESPDLDVEVLEVVDTGNVLVIVTREGDAGRLIGKSGKVAKKLSSELKKRVRIVEKGENLERMIQSIIVPLPLLGLNIRYTRGGETYCIRIPAGSVKKIRKTEIEQTLSVLLKRNVEICPE